MTDINIDPKNLKGRKLSDLTKTDDGTGLEVLLHKAGNVELMPVEKIIEKAVDDAGNSIDGKIAEAFRSIPFADEFDYLDNRNLQSAKNINEWLISSVRGGTDDNEDFIYSKGEYIETLGQIIDLPTNEAMAVIGYRYTLYSDEIFTNKNVFVGKISINFESDGNDFTIIFFNDKSKPYKSSNYISPNFTCDKGLFTFDLSEFNVMLEAGYYIGILNNKFQHYIKIVTNPEIRNGLGYTIIDNPYADIDVMGSNDISTICFKVELFEAKRNFGNNYRPGQLDLVRSVHNIVNDLANLGGVITQSNVYGDIDGDYDTITIPENTIVFTKIKDARPNFYGVVRFDKISFIIPTNDDFTCMILGVKDGDISNYMILEYYDNVHGIQGDIMSFKTTKYYPDNYDIYFAFRAKDGENTELKLSQKIGGNQTTLYFHNNYTGEHQTILGRPFGFKIETTKVLKSNILSNKNMKDSLISLEQKMITRIGYIEANNNKDFNDIKNFIGYENLWDKKLKFNADGSVTWSPVQ